jgi:hypothetical protein
VAELGSPYTYSSALGDNQCVAGTFRMDLQGGKVDWSDGMFQLHGYERGDVVPTLELLFSHKHPEDRQRCEDIVAQVCRTGGHFCMYHRIIDGRGRTRRVVTSGEAIADAAGQVGALKGTMVDLTSTLQRETEETARDAVAGATSTRSVIDQARGILMGQLKLCADDAFQMLVSTSSHRNVKLVMVAAELVQLANSGASGGCLDAAVRSMVEDSRATHSARRRAG